ncbi:MAG: short-chain dehydrogenase [Rhizobiaceae bacterium MnEN-MB40S]|nr:MAG: short-chain dehydrogenase [Rhizobiaceae bacterium MnEN-MB40S]
MNHLFSLEGKTAAVTGGASGLGLAIGECLHAAGAHLHLLDLDADTLARVSGSFGERVTTAVVDVSNRSLLRETIDGVAASRGSLDIVVANAGVTAGPGYLTDAGQINAVEDERWDRVVDVNLSSVFATIQAAAKHMKQQRSGRIIAVSSVAGLRSEVMCGYAYAATKAAVVNLVRQAAMELAQYNVMVNGIAPGPFRTNIAGGRIRQPEVEAQFASMVPLGRIAEPDEIKGLALLLASPASSFMTGSTIAVDGGIMAK